MLAVQGISQLAGGTRLALILGTLAIMAYWPRLLFMLIRALMIVLIVATVIGAVVIAKVMQG